MNLADSMRSQDNLNKVGHRKEKIKEEDEEYNSLPMDGGARGVMVIVAGNAHGDTSSNPGRD